MNDKDLNGLEKVLEVSSLFLKAAEEVKQANAEREKRNKAKAAAAADRRRREKALDEAYAEYCRNNPPTDSECRKAAEEIRSCLKEKEEKSCLK